LGDVSLILKFLELQTGKKEGKKEFKKAGSERKSKSGAVGNLVCRTERRIESEEDLGRVEIRYVCGR
jgi:hypothetical protein